MNNQSTQTQPKSARQTTETATESQTTRNNVSAFYLALLCLIGFTAPFWHVFHGISQREGLFGYKYMSSFLYALGLPVFAISVGLLFLYAVRYIDASHRKLFRSIAFIPLFIGCYYLIAVFIPKSLLLDAFGVRDFGNWVYYTIMIFMSVTSGYLFSLFQKAIYTAEEKLKAVIRRLFDFIVLDATKFIDQNKVNEYDVECFELISEVSEKI